MALPFVFRTGGVGVEEIHFDAAGDCVGIFAIAHEDYV